MKFKTKTFSYIIALMLFHISQSSIIVRSPPELRLKFPNGEIQAGYSNFGFIPYGYSLVGKLYFNQNDNNLGCSKESFDKLLSAEKPSIDNAPIIMTDRGSCNFVTKVKNIQDIGGHVAIIVNNNEIDPQNIIMADDGNGEIVKIPALLISKADGNILKDFYSKSKKSSLDRLSLEVNFEIEHKNNTVTLDFYMTSENTEIYNLIEEMQPYFLALGKSLLIFRKSSEIHASYDHLSSSYI